MDTVKFNRISVEVSHRIADTVATAAANGNVLTALERTALVNKALFKLFDEGWNQVQGNISAFIQVFPELLTSGSITVTSGVFTITNAPANKLRDFYAPVNGLKGTTYIRALSKELYSIVKASKYDDYIPDSDNPIMFEIQGTLSFFPIADFASETVTVYYIKLPLDPTTGSYLTQDGNYDSPFADKWNDKIVSLAEQIFKSEAQET